MNSLETLWRELQDYHQMFEASFNAAAIGKVIVSVTGHCLQVNPSLARMLGYEQSDLVGVHFADFTHPDDIDADLDLFAAVMRGERDTYQMEKRYIHHDGDVIDILLSVACVRDADGAPLQFISEIVDLTERNRARRELLEANIKLRRQVVTDHVTGLYNRRGFEEALVAWNAEQVSVLLIDLDNFKHINDRFGHSAGDLVLAEVGRRLPHLVRVDDIAARIGGDEFGLILRNADRSVATAIAERVVRELGAHYDIRGDSTPVGVSVGVSCPGPNIGASNIVASADAALYAAKRAGRGQWRLAA